MMKNNDVTAENIRVQITKQLNNFTLKYIVGGNIDLFTDMLECELRTLDKVTLLVLLLEI